ncbi:MAG: hypothetical protein EZS28_017310 [Streblomastix strix]|uniref:Uncharacterized protein n=1 Tax=Streblomastix strix TaxID=222440 RepID=A0A5J4VXU1_9EUKA|nr:MAG: hypothetical protein EZS28_017310 [Streblomastix strix]
MYESSWYDSGQLVPDQVTPASVELHIVNGTAAARNSTSYSRGDHIHTQQLTYEGNVTATKFINTGGTANDILQANKDTKKSVLASKLYRIIDQWNIQRRDKNKWELDNQWSNIQFDSDPNSNIGYVDNQWMIGTIGNNGQNQLGFTIVKAGQEGQTGRGLQISADGNTLTFNGSVIAGTGATTGASNGSVNYSQDNPIFWGANNTDPRGEFCSDGAKVYWRAYPLTMGSVPS